MTTEEKPLHLVELRAENVKRIRAVTIRPDGKVTVIGGRNAQGKSSLLDSIEMLLQGGRSIPIEPIRHGARKARIVGNFDEFIVERNFSAKGTTLVVKGKDGRERASPQKLLDSFCAKVSFDPFAFSRMEDEKQDALLKKLIGLDFSQIDGARQRVYDERTEANRELKRLDALLDQMPEHHDDAPKEPVSVAELTAKVEARSTAVAARAGAKARVDSMARELARQDEAIAKARTELANLERARAEWAEATTTAEGALPPEPQPIEEIQAQLRNAEATNAKVRANAERAKLEKQLAAKTEAVEEATAVIASLDDDKAQQLAKAKFPVDGLGFDSSGPTFRGVPLAQASQAEKLRLSVGIGAALNPRMKIMLVREGAFLDKDSLKLLAQLAEETGSQLFIERVGDGDAGAIVIEDGMVLEAPEETHVNGDAAHTSTEA